MFGLGPFFTRGGRGEHCRPLTCRNFMDGKKAKKNPHHSLSERWSGTNNKTLFVWNGFDTHLICNEEVMKQQVIVRLRTTAVVVAAHLLAGKEEEDDLFLSEEHLSVHSIMSLDQGRQGLSHCYYGSSKISHLD
eukprot:scaffold2267_cov187-Ochromonas_danica.AAC.2